MNTIVRAAGDPAPAKVVRARPATMSRKATGGSDEWCTPPEVLRRVRLIAPIALDPCTTASNPVEAASVLTQADNGLAIGWAPAGGLVYVNPPYSKAASWALKVVTEASKGIEVVTLVAARPDSRWFFRLCWETAAAVCFWKGRLTFVGAPSSAPFPSAAVYHGPRPWLFEQAFHDAGRVVRL